MCMNMLLLKRCGSVSRGVHVNKLILVKRCVWMVLVKRCVCVYEYVDTGEEVCVHL